MKRFFLGLILMGLVVAGCANQRPPANDDPAILPPDDVTWISPGKVLIGNFYPGARAEWNVTIHNGNEASVGFRVSYCKPARVGAGRQMVEAQDWVIIADPTPVLQPKETKEILIALDVPKGVRGLPDKWEFWVSAIEQGQGMVQTELVSRWLVDMR